MSRVIVVTSGKGGVGKSTCTASIGTALAEAGNRVLLIDADVGLNNLDVLIGVNDKVIYDMADVIDGRCRIKQALVTSDEVPNLFIMPSQHAYTSEDIGMKNFRILIDRLREGFDFILIDCPAGIERGFHRAVAPATEAIVVTTPHISSLRDADKVLGILAGYKLDSINLVVNRIRGDMVLSGEMMGADEIGKLLRSRPIGVVPEDDNIHVYSELGRLSSSDYKARRAFNCIADNIISGRRRIYDPTVEFRGVVGRIKMMIKRA